MTVIYSIDLCLEWKGKGRYGYETGIDGNGWYNH